MLRILNVGYIESLPARAKYPVVSEHREKPSRPRQRRQPPGTGYRIDVFTTTTVDATGIVFHSLFQLLKVVSTGPILLSKNRVAPLSPVSGLVTSQAAIISHFSIVDPGAVSQCGELPPSPIPLTETDSPSASVNDAPSADITQYRHHL